MVFGSVLALARTVLGAPLAPESPGAAPLDLVWNAPDGCPSALAVQGEIDRMLRGSTLRHAAARADVERLAPARWQVRLVTTVDGARGERSFEADSCSAIASATALIVAWSIDPARAAATEPEPSRPEPLMPAPRPPADVVPATATPPLRALLAVETQGDLGTLPTVGWATGLTLGAALTHFRVEASASLWLPQDVSRTTSEGTHLQLVEGDARGCWRGLITRSFEADPCAGAALLSVSSDGFGETKPYHQQVFWGAVDADVLATWTIFEPLALRALVGVSVPLARPTVSVDDAGTSEPFFRGPPVTGRASLGLQVHFP